MWMKHYKLNEKEQKLLDMTEKEFDEYMCKNFPNQFRDRRRRSGQKIILPMNFGFEIGRGWRHILVDLCEKLQLIEDKTEICCVFDQIKEKFGTGRFYHHTEILREEGEDGEMASDPNDELWCGIIEGLVNMAEEYTCYVDAYLGTNMQEEERVYHGSWIYDMGVKGYIQWVKDCGRYDEKEQALLINEAEEAYKRKKREREIREDFSLLSDQDINGILLLVERAKEERKRRFEQMVQKGEGK